MSIYLMRDNHTFRKLPDEYGSEVENAIARELANGETAILIGRTDVQPRPTVIRKPDEPIEDFCKRVESEIYKGRRQE